MRQNMSVISNMYLMKYEVVRIAVEIYLIFEVISPLNGF